MTQAEDWPAGPARGRAHRKPLVRAGGVHRLCNRSGPRGEVESPLGEGGERGRKWAGDRPRGSV